MDLLRSVAKRAVTAVRKRIADVEAILIGKEATSKELPEDKFVLQFDGQIIEPPYNPLNLYAHFEESSALRQSVEAMVVGTEAFGERFAPTVRVDDLPEGSREEVTAAIRKEQVQIRNFLTYVSTRRSFMDLRCRKRMDLEVTGNAYWEIVRDRLGRVSEINWLPSVQMRLGPQDENAVVVDMPFVLNDPETGLPYVQQKPVAQRFRPFCMGQYGYITRTGVNSVSVRTRWFKSYGDPRPMDCTTGKQMTDVEAQARPDLLATEVVWWSLPSILGPYGVPRWVGEAANVQGVRKAELVNLHTLDNHIPSMFVTVSQGRLTGGTLQRLEEYAKEVAAGKNFTRFVILEGETGYEDTDSPNPTKIEVTPLTKAQHTDALFSNYRTEGRTSARESFRIPAILSGSTKDYTKASADAARQVVDEMVFAPERNLGDWQLNRLIVDAGAKWNRLVSRTPNVTDNEKGARILAMMERTGANTPRLARAIAEDFFPQAEEVPPPNPKIVDPDVPFTLQMAEKVKNLAKPGEITQQSVGGQAVPPGNIRPQRGDGTYNTGNVDNI